MIKKLTLENFKNFKHAELELGPFTLLVGANATGKSNIREAFRFLHGIGRGYTIPDIIGEKYASGDRVWTGMRGGTSELAYLSENSSSSTFSLHLLEINETSDNLFATQYSSEVLPGYPNQTPRIVSESLTYDGNEIFDGWIDGMGDVFMVKAGPISPEELVVRWDTTRPVLLQIDPPLSQAKFPGYVFDFVETAKKATDKTRNTLNSMRFLEFDPTTMRKPSFPGQTTLGDNGENLSAVLFEICQDEQKKRVLTEWVRELTPMDATDFEFTPDQVGRILVTFVEKDGRKTSAYSASDGTLRFLGILAALLGPEPAQLYFFEEIENGIHPSRIHLLLELIEQVTSEGNIQVIATTHSPQLLGQVSEKTLENASLTYRIEGESDARIQRIMDIPDAREIFEEEDLSRLYEQGWLENSVHFLKNGKAPA